jgi:hypothetical protein
VEQGLCSTESFLHIIIGVAGFPGRVIRMAAHNMDFELKKLQLFIQFPFISSKIKIR